jgi:hypothetical protein
MHSAKSSIVRRSVTFTLRQGRCASRKINRLTVPQAGPNNHIGDARLVLEGHKNHARLRRRALPHENQARYMNTVTIAGRCQLTARKDAARLQLAPQEGDGVLTQRDQQLYTACHARPAPDQSCAFKRDNHLVGGWRCDAKVALQVGFGRRPEPAYRHG